MDGRQVIERLLNGGLDARYIAVAAGQELETWQREGLADASSGESDRYEELLVNPALVLLARQRGDIDCGGLNYLVIRYGNFFQVVVPTGAGHVSVAVEPTGDPVAVADRIGRLLAAA
ncbi:hypothetical protein Kfla_0170 [Kribbella flavida DSM 17836]|uniref:Uncharacterized protein n=1 Tax=Kribbella flavida (strain DSM 17836 / JCM 10339 / NBRC 14399) TaxID=479435 RepID=D2PRW9_KRIFD|nr:hypothetical protein [Kribbella flavida]ADB29299.1 hypothetical protein Kfla_0170 [Kribbella flavida DSM 17836]